MIVMADSRAVGSGHHCNDFGLGLLLLGKVTSPDLVVPKWP